MNNKRATLLLLVLGGVSCLTFAEVVSLRGDSGIDETNTAPSIKVVPKNHDKYALDYVNQPPLVPHTVDNYQINQANNGCLQCHDVDTYRKTGAPRISPTHYMDRDDNMLTEVAPRRYFCLQCHVPQSDAQPLVGNDFVPAGKFGE
ncbi:nitrate reductase cytochrome c-type subunit [Thaumasiovibrio sp. DFM-14]|uniref:nitrate reductase cytochrome c-type subunit n=1 Tax=Thaumasiovibrio sp. DFM-14 TaxID=3384792 RepID=UPI0039A0C6DC